MYKNITNFQPTKRERKPLVIKNPDTSEIVDIGKPVAAANSKKTEGKPEKKVSFEKKYLER